MGTFNRSFARVLRDRQGLARRQQLTKEQQEREIRRSVEAAALSARAEKQSVSTDSAGTPGPVKGAGQMSDYPKFVTQKEIDAQVEGEILRREYIQKNMKDLPPTYQDKLPRPSSGAIGGGLAAAEQAVRQQFAQDQEYHRRMTADDAVSVIARGLSQS